jgi:exopolysaccharide production protein ExoQ
MPPIIALLLGCALIYWGLRTDEARNGKMSAALIWPTIWYLVTASHPIGYWMQMWNLPMPGGSGDATDGSVVDRFFFGILTIIGLRILYKRDFDWKALFRNNRWLTWFLTLMLVSILWSHYPFVSFKRFIKVIGSVVMACVILTDKDPFVAFTTILRRMLYVHLPMSILCVKYYRDIGVGFDWSGNAEDWQGIATSKNVLGQVAMLGTIYFAWEVWRNWKTYKWKNIHLIYLYMAIHLLLGSRSDSSKTSLSVCLFGLFIFFRLQSLRSRPEAIRPFVYTIFAGTACLICVVIAHSIFMFPQDSIFGQFISMLGRDITMTGRTYIWSDVYAAARNQSSLLGVGFGAFWIGRLANIPWNAHMTWVLAQAHSGYADTFLQLGYAGAFMLAGLLFTSLPKVVDSVSDDFDFGCFKITLFITITFVDMTESIYLRGDHHLWLLLMIILWRVPRPQVQESSSAVPEESMATEASGVGPIHSWDW